MQPTPSAAAAQCSQSDLQRIEETLLAVAREVAQADLSNLEITRAENGDPTTMLDLRINQIIHKMLPSEGEGWLSEETGDDLGRLQHRRTWIVDPIDGTREFVEGIPEWAVSIGLSIDHEAVAGGVLNPCTGELFLGSISEGMRVVKIETSHCTVPLDHDACVLVSRREFSENKWASYVDLGLRIKPVGSIAYRLARVAAGLDYATCTFEPRSEWDVAAGVALMYASGGRVEGGNRGRVRFNNEDPRLSSFFAFAENCPAEIPRILGRHSIE